MTKKLLSISIVFLSLCSCKKHSTENVVQAAPVDTLAKLLANPWRINKEGYDSNNNGIADSGETHVESPGSFYVLTFYSNYILSDTNHYTYGSNLGRLGAWHWGANKSHIFIAQDSIDFEEFTINQITDTSLLIKKLAYNYWWECIRYQR